jgi:hypothetical protein
LKKKILVLTEDMSFFFKLNRELNQKNIPFEILNKGNKIPEFNTLILTTHEEWTKIKLVNYNTEVLAYNKEEKFDKFLIKLIAAFKIGYKDRYSELTFSIDPGTKNIGIVIFLDDYFLISQTIYNEEDLINKIKDYVDYLQNSDKSFLNLNFKFGRGILPLTLHLVSRIFNIFHNRKNMRIFLIDEFKSSKIKICNNLGKKMPKDEASALILALRNGIEVSQTNYINMVDQIKLKKLNKNIFRKENTENSFDLTRELRKIVENVLNGEYSLSRALEILQHNQEFN